MIVYDDGGDKFIISPERDNNGAISHLVVYCEGARGRILPANLTQEQVKKILPALQHFAETGELPEEGEAASGGEAMTVLDDLRDELESALSNQTDAENNLAAAQKALDAARAEVKAIQAKIERVEAEEDARP